MPDGDFEEETATTTDGGAGARESFAVAAPEGVAVANPEKPEDPERNGEGEKAKRSRLHAFIALCIAAVSVLGAVASWRIEDHHAAAAAELDQSAVAATITDSRLKVEARATADQFNIAFQRYERLSDEADRLAAGGCPDQGQAVDDFNAEVACELQVVFAADDNSYASTSGRTFDVSRLARDVKAENVFEADNNPAPYQAAARNERHTEDRLLLLTLVLVLSLALLTIAHLSKPRRVILRSAVPGWVLMGASLAFLLVWEI